MSSTKPVHVREGSPALTRRAFLGASACLGAAVAVSGLAGCADAGGEGSDSSDASDANAPAGESQEAEPLQETLFVFDTVVTLTAYCDEELMSRACERCQYFEEHLSRTLEGSDVWNVNNAHGEPVTVAAETADVIARALEYGELSGGLFDITIGAVSQLWDFHEGVLPADADIQAALPHVDYHAVSVDGTTVQLSDPLAAIDLGGIAKGYIADDLARLFREGGCTSGTINLGGNVYALGSKPDGSNWNVGIQDPNAPATSSVIASLSCADTSVVTSGLYERTFTVDGTQYYHILDPTTGYPAQTDLVSSSVASASSTDGDAYATWMFLLGRDEALALLERTDGLEGLVEDSAGEISMTSQASFVLR